MTDTRITYSPVGQSGGYNAYTSLTDLLSEGFAADTEVDVEVSDGYILTRWSTTVGALRTARTQG